MVLSKPISMQIVMLEQISSSCITCLKYKNKLIYTFAVCWFKIWSPSLNGE